MSKSPQWTEDRVEQLIGIVGSDTSTEVSAELQETAAESLGVSVRSIGAKLRNLGYSTASTAKAAKGKAYTEAEEEELRAFVESNPGQYTYAEIAENVLNGSRTAREIQGKLLSMELFDKVKPTPKQEAAKSFSDEEEAIILRMMEEGAFIEDIAEAVNREVKEVRGKALSLTRKYEDLTVPKQKQSNAAVKQDVFEGLDIPEMTVAELVEATGKTERGIKTMLTRRALTAKDYDGAKKAAKKAEKAA